MARKGSLEIENEVYINEYKLACRGPAALSRYVSVENEEYANTRFSDVK